MATSAGDVGTRMSIRATESSVNAQRGREGSPPICTARTSRGWPQARQPCTGVHGPANFVVGCTPGSCTHLRTPVTAPGSFLARQAPGRRSLRPSLGALAYPAARTRSGGATWWADTRPRSCSGGTGCTHGVIRADWCGTKDVRSQTTRLRLVSRPSSLALRFPGWVAVVHDRGSGPHL